jgi:NAD(P)-dependent dehydrogenase (short-subunit alcohol dehydrogenase family)
MSTVNGKVAIVTGAGSGIGRACFKLAAAQGARVVGVSRTRSKLEETLAEVAAAGGQGIVVPGDLSDSAAADAAVAAAVERYGRVDILIHAAGVGYALSETLPGSMNAAADTSDENWRAVMRINLDACFFINRAALRVMRRQKQGAIVNVGSIFGLGGYPDAHTYTAAKAGMINFTRSLAVAYAKEGIRANCVAPGFVDTPMIASVMHFFDDPAIAASLSPMGRAAKPEEIANCCLFLASDMASYCNGATLSVDGGSTATV